MEIAFVTMKLYVYGVIPPDAVADIDSDCPRSIPGAFGEMDEITKVFGTITLNGRDSTELVTEAPALEESFTITFVVNVPACVAVYA